MDSHRSTLAGRCGGVYTPSFELARMLREVQDDKTSTEYQRLAWDALRRSINGLVNKVTATNIKNIIQELFGENLIRGRGLFCRSCIKSQMASLGFTGEFAALVAVVNTEFPEPNPHFLENEKRYEEIKKSILGEESEEEDGSNARSVDEESNEEQMKINDDTGTNLVNLRSTIYLIIMSSRDFKEAGHKLLKIKLEPGQEKEPCAMLLECCSQEKTYLRYYSLLGKRFCMINRVYLEEFRDMFESIFPKDSPENTEVSIRFFTYISLESVPKNLREYQWQQRNKRKRGD
ncbi:hypothetical protein CRG98_015595 [Punica granatum]|uniref:MI domain-containing protein n=1 Tax=Punica granatum TaxID=22663 RepID=A0A2I0K630_PUNGR|nr:hypothetical protein CRG98_015595 [Punica granatum]